MKRCVQCRAELLSKTIRCPYCGAVQEEEQKKEEESKVEEPKKEAHSLPDLCPRCEKELTKDYLYCPWCGAKVKEKNKNEAEEFSSFERKTERAVEGLVQNIKNGELKYPKGLLKLFGIIFGIIYAYYALSSLSRISYINSYPSERVLGLCMTLACTWNMIILLLISFRCQKQFGRNLAYALFGGSILKGILHIIRIQKAAKYYIPGVSAYYPVAVTALFAIVIYYLMKKEGQIDEEKQEPISKVLKDIPGILLQLLSEDPLEAGEEKENKTKKVLSHMQKPLVKEKASGLGQIQTDILGLTMSGVSLLFCFLYTGNLLYELFAEFSFLKWIENLLPIILCVALWKIYLGSRKNELNEQGFCIARGVMTAEYVIQIILSVILCIVGTIFGGPIGLILTVVISLVDICYRGSLRRIFLCMESVAKGSGDEVAVSFYPVLILGVNAVVKTVAFLWTAFWQGAANSVTHSMYGYGDAASSLVAGILSSMGIDYGYGYGQTSSLMRYLIAPMEEWIQNKFGFKENPVIMMLAIAIPICEIILLSKLRSLGGQAQRKEEEQSEKDVKLEQE